MDVFTGKAIDIINFLMDKDKTQLWDLIIHKKKKTLSQNGYYWQLIEKIVLKTHIPKAEIHNTNLRNLGFVQRVGDEPVFMLLPDTEKAEKDTLLATTYHLAPRSETKVGTDGKTYRWYVMLRGSSDFSVEEMSALVDLAVQDAKSLDIEVMTPMELEHLRELERQHEQKQKNKSL